MADDLSPEIRAELERRGWVLKVPELQERPWKPIEYYIPEVPTWERYDNCEFQASAWRDPNGEWITDGAPAYCAEFAAIVGLSVPGYVTVPVRVRPDTTGPGYVAEFHLGGVAYTETGDTPEAATQALAAALKGERT